MTLPRPRLLFLAAALAFGLTPPAHAQDRRTPTSPGLVLNTGARHAACDVLRFTPDGKELLAAGDDKVVRVWPVGPAEFTEHRSRNLRWPIFREQRGGIFAMSLSPDSTRVAVAGYGVKTGLVVILNRKKRTIEHALEEVTSGHPVWSLTFTPSGKRVVYGTESGEVFVWDFTGKAKKATQF